MRYIKNLKVNNIILNGLKNGLTIWFHSFGTIQICEEFPKLWKRMKI